MSVPFALEKLKIHCVFCNDMYSMFKFESLHNLRLGISNQLSSV